MPKKQIKILLPPLAIQRKIASILTSHDDRIAEKIQEIVDAKNTAIAIYEKWFVNFRFPDHESKELVDSPLGQIPDGWQTVPLSDIAKISMGVSLAGWQEDNATEGIIPWVQSNELADRFLMTTKEKITESGLKTSSSEVHPRHTVIMATSGAEVGQLGILGCEAAIDESCCAVRANDSDFGHPFVFLYFLTNREKIVDLASTSPQQSINKDLLQQVKITRPPASVITSFNDAVSPTFNQMHTLQESADKLQANRDLMLVRLMSGPSDEDEIDQLIKDMQ